MAHECRKSRKDQVTAPEMAITQTKESLTLEDLNARTKRIEFTLYGKEDQ
jgi:hypothetical protein